MRHRQDSKPPRTLDEPDLVDAFLEREVGRRRWLQGALAAAALWATGSSRGAFADAEKPTRHLVGMGQDAEHLVALDRALEEVGGLDFLGSGDTVYFKVNCNSGDAYPHSTSPALIEALAKRCRDHGVKRIIVGDRSFYGDRDTMGNLEANGIAAAAKAAEAELVSFESDTVEWVHFAEEKVPDWNGGIRMPRPVVEADHIINLPCVKTHFIAHFTMALKNGIGLVHPVDRAKPGNLLSHDTESGRLWRQIAQLNSVFTPSLNILDGHRSLITGGPNAGSMWGAAEATYAEPQIVIASPDRIAVDMAGVALLQTLSPESEEVTRATAWAQPQIEAAVKAGLGLSTLEHFDLSGPTVEKIEAYRSLATQA